MTQKAYYAPNINIKDLVHHVEQHYQSAGFELETIPVMDIWSIWADRKNRATDMPEIIGRSLMIRLLAQWDYLQVIICGDEYWRLRDEASTVVVNYITKKGLGDGKCFYCDDSDPLNITFSPGEKCPECGGFSSEGARFCAQCGAPMDNDCPGCGLKNTAGAAFCEQCGASLGR